MKGFLSKAKAEIKGILDSDPRAQGRQTSNQQSSQQPTYQPSSPSLQQLPLKGMSDDGPNNIQEPTSLDILRYRYHHGTNLGSIYVLERWLHPSRFLEECGGSSELESVKAWVDKVGLEETKTKFEEQWKNAVSDDDIKWLLEEAKCTTIRLPIGYFDLDSSLLKGTPFEPYKAVYAGAWASIWTLISRLRAHSIGVLLDIHALPGGANGQEHSGTNSGESRLFSESSNRDLGVRCCKFIANEVVKGMPLAGLQIVNEADFGSERLFEWYDSCITAISAIDPSIPVVVSDAWNLDAAIDYVLGKNAAYPKKPTCPVIIDTHYYWCFSDADKAKTPQDIIAEVDTKLSELDGKEGRVCEVGAVQVVVGEYSCVLTEDSWAKGQGTSKEELVQRFGQAQSRKWQSRAGGSFFWTWKMDWFPGGEWGFHAQTSSQAIAPHPSQNTIHPENHSSLLEKAHHCRDERMWATVDQHVTYWNNQSPTMGGEHWRYENGWKVGYNDALAFFQGRSTEAVQGGNRIGNVEMWVLKRIRESGFRGKFVWEFEQGLRRGIADFYSTVGI